MGRNQKMGIDAPTRVELEEYLRFTPRRRRYRDADKTFRFFVYQILEIYVAMALILDLLAFGCLRVRFVRCVPQA